MVEVDDDDVIQKLTDTQKLKLFQYMFGELLTHTQKEEIKIKLKKDADLLEEKSCFSKIWNISNLRQLIFEFLDTRSIVMSQGVNHTWKRWIKCSPTIFTALDISKYKKSPIPWLKKLSLTCLSGVKKLILGDNVIYGPLAQMLLKSCNSLQSIDCNWNAGSEFGFALALCDRKLQEYGFLHKQLDNTLNDFQNLITQPQLRLLRWKLTRPMLGGAAVEEVDASDDEDEKKEKEQSEEDAEQIEKITALIPVRKNPKADTEEKIVLLIGSLSPHFCKLELELDRWEEKAGILFLEQLLATIPTLTDHLEYLKLYMYRRHGASHHFWTTLFAPTLTYPKLKSLIIDTTIWLPSIGTNGVNLGSLSHLEHLSLTLGISLSQAVPEVQLKETQYLVEALKTLNYLKTLKLIGSHRPLDLKLLSHHLPATLEVLEILYWQLFWGHKTIVEKTYTVTGKNSKLATLRFIECGTVDWTQITRQLGQCQFLAGSAHLRRIEFSSFESNEKTRSKNIKGKLGVTPELDLFDFVSELKTNLLCGIVLEGFKVMNAPRLFKLLSLQKQLTELQFIRCSNLKAADFLNLFYSNVVTLSSRLLILKLPTRCFGQGQVQEKIWAALPELARVNGKLRSEFDKSPKLPKITNGEKQPSNKRRKLKFS